MRAFVAGLAVVPLVLAGCASVSSGTPVAGGVVSSTGGGGTSTGAGPTAVPTHGGAPELTTQLLTLADMPTGWTVDNSNSDDNSSAPSCFQHSDGLAASIHAERSFVAPDSIPAVDQSISYYETSGRAESTYADGVAIFDKCKDVSFTSDDGTKITGRMGRTSFPKKGNRSVAYRLDFAAQGITLGMYILVVQKGAEVETVLYIDFGVPSLDQFTTLANKAVAKMPA